MSDDKERRTNEQPYYEYGGEISHTKKVDYSIESENTKPFDIFLMTGNNDSTESEDEQQ